VAIDELLLEIAGLFLENHANANNGGFGGRGERHAVVYIQMLHVAAPLFGNHVGVALHE